MFTFKNALVKHLTYIDLKNRITQSTSWLSGFYPKFRA